MKGEFALVTERIRLIIEKKELDLNSLILKLRTVDDEKKTIFSTDDAFTKVQCITDLFRHILNHCNIYDYEILISFVTSTDCEEAKKMLEDFTQMLHSSILSDLDLLHDAQELHDPKGFIPGTHRLVIKYVGGKSTMKTQILVKNIVYERYKLPYTSIIFRGVEGGSIAFIYQISSAVKAHILKHHFEAVFSEEDKVTHLAIDGQELSKCFVCKFVIATVYSI